MPRVVPSLVVRFLDSSGLSPERELSAQHVAVVSALLDLVVQVPDTHLQVLLPEEYAKLTIALGVLRGALGRWVNVSAVELGQSGGRPLIKNVEALGNAHPVAVLRDLLSKCPDEVPAEHVGDLAFLGADNVDLAGVLRQDMTTAHTALTNLEFKAACVMAGSVVEALLLWALKRKSPDDIGLAIKRWHAEPGAKVPALSVADLEAREWSFSPLLSVARRIAPEPLLSDGTAKLAESMNEFRNLIHPGRAARLSLKPTLGMAHVAVGVMRQAADELAALVAGGKL